MNANFALDIPDDVRDDEKKCYKITANAASRTAAAACRTTGNPSLRSD